MSWFFFLAVLFVTLPPFFLCCRFPRPFLHNTFSLSLLTTSLSLSWLLQSSAWSSLVSYCGLHRLHDWVVLVRWNGLFELRALLDRDVSFSEFPHWERYAIVFLLWFLLGRVSGELGIRAVSFFLVCLFVIVFTAFQILSFKQLGVVLSLRAGSGKYTFRSRSIGGIAYSCSTS